MTSDPTRASGATSDFASLDEVRRLGEEVKSGTAELVNNAGIGSGLPDLPTRQESRDGHELRLAVNHLAPFLPTAQLLPLLRRSAPARIVNVASIGQAPMDFEDPMIERGYDGPTAYSQSKLAQITAGFELAERLAGDSITVNSLHPATHMPTKIALANVGHSIDTLEAGIEATRALAIAPELEGISGRFYDRQSESRAHEQAYDPAARRALWDLSVKLAGARFE